MIDRDRVIGILADPAIADRPGQELLERLEAEGYRVVRAGMVPQFDDLDDVSRMLSVLGRQGGNVQHNSIGVRDAALTIRQLRDLALAVLRIDVDDVDPTDV